MLAFLIAAMSASADCPVEQVVGVPGENHVMFRGLSPDGRSLAVGWDRGSGEAIERGAYLLDLATGVRTAIPHLNNAPSFSPDGRFLVAANYGAPEVRTEIVELNRSTGQARTFATNPATEWLASYSSDGRWILFNSMRSGRSDLFRVSRSDGAIEQLTSDPRYEAHGQWIDGDRGILFHRQTEGDNYDIVIRDLGSGSEQLVGATPLEESYPAMSPDGRWIAFSAVTEPGKPANLFVMARDGSARRQLTAGLVKEAYATWSPDGRSIYFVRFPATGAHIVRIAMDGGDCVPTSRRH